MKRNNKAARKHKFNIVDAVVLFIILAVAVTAFLWIDPMKWLISEEDDTNTTVLFVLELKDMDKNISNTINVGDNVVLYEVIGKVTEINKTASMNWSIPENGDQMILFRHPNTDTVFVTIEIQCSYREGVGYFINGKQILVGQSMEYTFPWFSRTGECISITEKEQGGEQNA